MVLRSNSRGRRLSKSRAKRRERPCRSVAGSAGTRTSVTTGWAMHGGRIEAEDEVTLGFRNGRTVQNDLKLE